MRADGHLFLRPTHVTEDGRATQPCASKKFARGIESLRCAPAQLAADDGCRAQHACPSRAWSRGEADAAKGVSQRAHLLVTSRVCQLRLGYGLAPARSEERRVGKE